MCDAISDPKCAFDVTVATDASAYDAGDVVSGTVTVNRVGAMKVRVRSAVRSAPAPAPSSTPSSRTANDE